MPGFSFPPDDNQKARFQDTGQGASGRIASWEAWGADPSPLIAPATTNIWRSDNNYGVTPLGQGGVGDWAPFLDGFSNGATSGGDNCFFTTEPPVVTPTDDYAIFLVVLWGI